MRRPSLHCTWLQHRRTQHFHSRTVCEFKLWVESVGEFGRPHPAASAAGERGHHCSAVLMVSKQMRFAHSKLDLRSYEAACCASATALHD